MNIGGKVTDYLSSISQEADETALKPVQARCPHIDIFV